MSPEVFNETLHLITSWSACVYLTPAAIGQPEPLAQWRICLPFWEGLEGLLKAYEAKADTIGLLLKQDDQGTINKMPLAKTEKFWRDRQTL